MKLLIKQNFLIWIHYMNHIFIPLLSVDSDVSLAISLQCFLKSFIYFSNSVSENIFYGYAGVSCEFWRSHSKPMKVFSKIRSALLTKLFHSRNSQTAATIHVQKQYEMKCCFFFKQLYCISHFLYDKKTKRLQIAKCITFLGATCFQFVIVGRHLQLNYAPHLLLKSMAGL